MLNFTAHKLIAAFGSISTDDVNAISIVIGKDEGGWLLTKESDDSDGGWTYGGMTARTFGQYFAPTPTYTEAENIVASSGVDQQSFRQLIISVYYEEFVVGVKKLLVGGDTFHPAYLSCAINCGMGGFHSIITQAITNYGANGTRETKGKTFCTVWKDHYLSICRSNPGKLPDLGGWINRVWKYLP